MFSHLALRNPAAVVVLLLTIGLSFVAASKSYSDVDLSSEEVQEAAKQGFDRADRDAEKNHLEQIKAEGNFSEEGTARLRVIDGMNQQYEEWKKGSKIAGDVAERARRVRALQYKIEELADSKDFGAPRKRAVWRDEMRYLTHQTPELPELPPRPTSSTQNR